jgi:hypothetical protein
MPKNQQTAEKLPTVAGLATLHRSCERKSSSGRAAVVMLTAVKRTPAG